MKALLLLCPLIVAQVPPVPSNMAELECALHKLALEYSDRNPEVPSRDGAAVYDALRIKECGGATVPRARPARETEAAMRHTHAHSAEAFYVATTGSDTNDGSLAAPWASVHHAVQQLRAKSLLKPTIFVRGGVYLFSSTLELNAADANLTIASYEKEEVTFSGGRSLKGAEWECSTLRANCAVFKTKVSLPHRSASLGPDVVNQLFVNRTRMVRARYPNGNPQTTGGHCFSKAQYANENCTAWLVAANGSEMQPEGTIVANLSYGQNRGESPTVGCPQCTTYGDYKYTIYDPPAGHPVYNKPIAGMGWSNNSLYAMFGSPFKRPAEFSAAPGDLPREWADPSTGVVHMFHPLLWGGWMFRVASRTGDNLRLAYGGYQEGRGAGIKSNHYYVENIIEELDVPGEWFYDEAEEVLYLYPNATATPQSLSASDVVVPLLDTVVRIRGGEGERVASDITLAGITFTQTRATFLEQYEVPSGGDWSIHRGGAVFVEDATRVRIVGCEFFETGGNAVFLSNNVTFSYVGSNEFLFTGDSAVVALGRTDRLDGTAATYPMNNTVALNHMHEYGVYGKQTSCFFQSLSANTTLQGNLCYNGPRAGFNFNDGFGGGHDMKENLLFNHVRETGDHGPFNSWDREPYLTRSGVDDGFTLEQKCNVPGASMIKAQSYIRNNFFINGYNGVWTIDHDDGSQFYNDSSNVMAWGGCKNFLGNSKSCDHNLIIYPGIPNRSQVCIAITASCFWVQL